MSITTPRPTRRYHAAVWRWHFYAGLVVMPFFVMAALTGMVMVLKTPFTELVHGARLNVEIGAEMLPPSQQVAVAMEYWAEAELRAYLPPSAPDRAAIIHVAPGHAAMASGEHSSHDGGNSLAYAVHVNPYTGAITGYGPLGMSPADFAESLHGTLLMGDVGDVILEAVAGFGILMIATGLYLYWPAGRRPLGKGGRSLWRRIHGLTGLGVSVVLVFFLVSGLAWTPIWGGKVTQAWQGFPAERFSAPVGEARHEALNAPGARIVSWALEKTPLPVSAHDGDEPLVGLDAVVAFARDEGFTRFRVLPPRGPGGTWTISATTMAGDITDPEMDRTMHIDPATGIVIADAPFADYSPMGKAMAAGISIHMGNAGALNLILNLLFCIAILVMAVSGFIMWWVRRPLGARRIAAPMADSRSRWTVAGILLIAALLFPVTAAVMAVIYTGEAIAALAARKGRPAR
ncbi:PepSY-associated TM helix domain-containing protein [Aquisalinus flavus]|uniref:Membrane protein n=1 Tax=Aquisalinus flavus TaxID=1526572 RepID=A0A8J2Y7C5_9PROT|nr:PepSY domain-containing protein [Aquisalinus flavus]MBD0425831.1 PepSY domain-containing protein [Aquisalinus flavus]UNE48566.1 PepSY domain-containing protein [Aquisalinus flavus]GGD12905.1 membrane protein [Aquisalinus flavus]